MTTHDSIVSENRFVLAFYGATPSATAGECFFRMATDWFDKLGYSPDRLGVTGAGYGAKVGDYHRGLSRLHRRNFAGVESLELHASLPGARDGSLEYFVSAGFSQNPRLGGYAVFAAPALVSVKGAWRPISQQIVECVRPAYGIAFERPLSLGPVWYALGVCYGLGVGLIGEAYEEARMISRWSNLGMAKEVYRQGVQRGVYRWNFLTQRHLDKQVDGMRLAEWIERDGRRGTLSPLCNEVWLWEVDDARRQWLHDKLHEAGVVFDWRNFLCPACRGSGAKDGARCDACGGTGSRLK